MESKKKPNRLIAEKSPYLLQHAYNPVQWYPWGEEAFKKARQENRPIFLSIGYSTCHWCHVMERESFENEEVAELLNERFVSIKVDREERPDIDSIYMQICQMMNGQGGWPLSVFMTPDQIPFYTGTYFPRESRYGMPGFKDVILYLSDQYKNNHSRIIKVAAQIKEALNKDGFSAEKEELTIRPIESAFHHFSQTFDHEYGGFGTAPKFPTPHTIQFLLMYGAFFQNEKAGDMALKTLDGMKRGGIYDHIGFGFSRYSVDEKFLVPHFEKMLYDNALLMMAYTDAYRLTKAANFKEAAEQIAEYVLRDMQHGDGGFCSAEDADSEGVEGKFYVWTPGEVLEVLGKDLGRIFCEAYDITAHGNFEGKSIPNLIASDLETLAQSEGMTISKLKEKLEKARQRLFEHRKKRIHPFKDDKILTAWNGLMIAALAKAARVFENEEYIQSARKAITFIETNLVSEGRLMVRFRDGESKHAGFLEDYAFLLWGYVELFETVFDLKLLMKAKNLAAKMKELFWDEAKGGFFHTARDHEKLLIRQKESYDGALPSGNSAAAFSLLKLAKLTGDYQLEEMAEQIFQTFSSEMNGYPNGHTMMLQALLLSRQKMKEVVILYHPDDKKAELLIKKIQQSYHPEITLLASTDDKELAKAAPFTEGYRMIDNGPTIYICENFQCRQPANDLETAEKELLDH